MATTFGSLSAADQADFRARMGIFGLNETHVIESDLVVPAKSTVTLSAKAPNSFLRPRLLATDNIDELKNWIGVDNQLIEKGKVISRLPIPSPLRQLPNSPAVAGRASAVAPAQLAGTPAVALQSRELNDVRAAATAYLWGHSSSVASYKSLIETVFPNMQIVLWPLLTITVNRGAVLQLGPGQNALVAWKIVIESGGTIRGSDGLTVRCTILQKGLGLILTGPPVNIPIHV
jgi:hypothetical protein